MNAFDHGKNPAFDEAESRLFVAYKKGRVAGRIAALHPRTPNRKGESRNLRFGWLDAIEDEEVFRALFNAVTAWARELGMETISGPYGFFDLDANGVLVAGFDQFCTPSGNFNHPYYPRMIERCGLAKAVDYVEHRSLVPTNKEIPERLLALSRRIRARGMFQIVEFKRKKDLLKRADELFCLINEAFMEMYGSSPLTPRQTEHYIRKFLPFLDKDLIKIAVNEAGDMIGFILSMPCLTRAFQKAQGRLFPLGWFHLLRALRKNDTLEFLLAFVKKSYRGQGVDLVMVIEIARKAISRGFRYTESNQELESNEKIHAQWKYFQSVQNKRRRIFKMTLPAVGRG